MSKKMKKGTIVIAMLMTLVLLGGCSLDTASTILGNRMKEVGTAVVDSKKAREVAKIRDALVKIKTEDGAATKGVQTPIGEIPQYDGEDFASIGNGFSAFTEEELGTASKGTWIKYGELDELNRVTEMNALVGPDNLRTGSDANGSILPTGWNKQNQKPDNPKRTDRGHLLANVLGGSGDDMRNLMTLYRRANHPAMYNNAEKIVQYAIEDTGAIVRYRVTPVFVEDSLIADGVQIMAKSVNNDSVDFSVYIFNQP